MAYVVTREIYGYHPEKYYFMYKSSALEMYNKFLREEGSIENVIEVPHRINKNNKLISISRLVRCDTTNDKFIFFDNEENWLLVLGDRATFGAEYVRLAKKYEKNEREWSDFYDKLERKLLGRGVQIITDIPIIREKDLDWE